MKLKPAASLKAEGDSDTRCRPLLPLLKSSLTRFLPLAGRGVRGGRETDLDSEDTS